MRKLFFLAVLLSASSACSAQNVSVDDSTSAFWRDDDIIDIALFPLYDSLGNATYIRRSDVAAWKDPKNKRRIYYYDYHMEREGYYDPARKRNVKLKKKG